MVMISLSGVILVRLVIECKWQNTERDNDGRVKQKDTKGQQRQK
jgi:hypothetical protein